MLAPTGIREPRAGRARQTAHALGIRCHRRVVLDPRLREIGLGGWTGLTRAQAARAIPPSTANGAPGPTSAAATASAPPTPVPAPPTHSLPPLPTHRRGPPWSPSPTGFVLQAAIRRVTDPGVAVPGADNPHLPNAGWLVVPLADRTGRMG
jgi:hypothetical protein